MSSYFQQRFTFKAMASDLTFYENAEPCGVHPS